MISGVNPAYAPVRSGATTHPRPIVQGEKTRAFELVEEYTPTEAGHLPCTGYHVYEPEKFVPFHPDKPAPVDTAPTGELKRIFSSFENGKLQIQVSEGAGGTLAVFLDEEARSDTTPQLESLHTPGGLDDPEIQRSGDWVHDRPISYFLEAEKRRLAEHGGDLFERYGGGAARDVLEIGAGTTTFVAQTLVPQGHSYTGVDLVKTVVDKQSEILNHLGPEFSERCQSVAGDLFDLPIEDASQDVVVAYAAFPTSSSYETTKKAFSEIHRVLRPGGEFYVKGVGLQHAAPATLAYVLENFEVVGIPAHRRGHGFILRKPEISASP